MLQGWKIIQHGWNAKLAFWYSIPQFNQKCGVANDLLRSLHKLQEWENVLDHALWNRFFIFQLLQTSHPSSKTKNGAADLMVSRELSLSTGISSLRLLLRDLDILPQFPHFAFLKPVLLFSNQQASLLLAPSHPSNESMFTLVTTRLFSDTSQHPAPGSIWHQVPAPLLKFLKACGPSALQFWAPVLFFLSHLFLLLSVWLCKWITGTFQSTLRRTSPTLTSLHPAWSGHTKRSVGTWHWMEADENHRAAFVARRFGISGLQCLTVVTCHLNRPAEKRVSGGKGIERVVTDKMERAEAWCTLWPQFFAVVWGMAVEDHLGAG